MGCALPSAHRLGGAGPAQLGDSGGRLRPDSTLGAGSARPPAEREDVEDPWAGRHRDAGLLDRYGTDAAIPARYLAQSAAERVLSRRLGSPADRGPAAQRLVSTGSALQHAVPELPRQLGVAELSGGGNVADQRLTVANSRTSRR